MLTVKVDRSAFSIAHWEFPRQNHFFIKKIKWTQNLNGSNVITEIVTTFYWNLIKILRYKAKKESEVKREKKKNQKNNKRVVPNYVESEHFLIIENTEHTERNYNSVNNNSVNII